MTTKTNTFEDIYLIWAEEYKNTVKPSTFAKTNGIVKSHSLKRFKHIAIDKITTAMCMEMIEALTPTEEKVRNGKTGQVSNPKHIINYTKLIFKKAIELKLIESNPMDLIKPPSEAKNVKKGKPNLTPQDVMYDHAQMESIKIAAHSMGIFKHKIFFLMMVDTGMRKQELVGLNWSDIDFDNGAVSVTKVLSYAPGIGNYLDDIRDGSERVITFSDKSIIPLLLEWKSKQSEELRGIIKADDQQPIFNNTNNEHEASSATARYFKALYNNEDCKTVTATGIRNTVCKTLLKDGVDILEVMRKCGYVDGRIPLRIYEKVVPASVQLENGKLVVAKIEAYKKNLFKLQLVELSNNEQNKNPS